MKTLARPFGCARRRLAAALVFGGVALGPLSASAEGAALRDLCAERPGRATPACIVDRGHAMLEVDVLDVIRDRRDGGKRQTTVALSPHLRVGLTDRIEAGITLAPFVEARTRGDPAGATTVRGTGDTVVNLKINLKNPSGAGFSLALLPFVSAPNAQNGLGAGGFQGGIVAPVGLALPAGFALTLDPEVDAVRDGRGGVRPAYVMAASLSHAVFADSTLGVELWSSAVRMPGGWERQTTADVSLAWIPSRWPDVQFDMGANLGLSDATPGVQAYMGVSRRF